MHTCKDLSPSNCVLNALGLDVCADFTTVGGPLGPELTFSSGLGTALWGVSALEELHLTGHIINGSWPAALVSLPLLKVLRLSGPGAPGSALPAEWGNMTQLQSLWLFNITALQGVLRTYMC